MSTDANEIMQYSCVKLPVLSSYLRLNLRHSKTSRSDVHIEPCLRIIYECNCSIHWAIYTCGLTGDLPEIQFRHPALQVLQLSSREGNAPVIHNIFENSQDGTVLRKQLPHMPSCWISAASLCVSIVSPIPNSK